MALYHFNIRDRLAYIPDDEGYELEPALVPEKAHRMAYEIMIQAALGASHAHGRFEVTDDAGVLVYEMAFSDSMTAKQHA